MDYNYTLKTITGELLLADTLWGLRNAAQPLADSLGVPVVLDSPLYTTTYYPVGYMADKIGA